MSFLDELMGRVITEIEVEDGRLYGATVTSQDGKIYTVGSAYDSNPALDVERMF